ncbi:MAG: hypothetical protein AAGA48_13650 [Myxococcota bacterium]
MCTGLLFIVSSLGSAFGQDVAASNPPEPPECEQFVLGSCTDPQPMETNGGVARCHGFETTLSYEPDENGDCQLTGIQQSNGWVLDIPLGGCNTSSEREIDDGDGCPDAVVNSMQVVSPSTWCCSSCDVGVYETRVVLNGIDQSEWEWECVLVGTIREDVCFPGDCTPDSPFISDILNEVPEIGVFVGPSVQKLALLALKHRLKNSAGSSDEDTSEDDDESDTEPAN